MSIELGLIKMSPSKLDKLVLCPCYKTDAFVASQAADRGKLLHKALETGDRSEVEPEDMSALDFCLGVRTSVIEYLRGVAEREACNTIQEIFELRVTVYGGSNGYIDYLARTNKHAYVLDWKFGQELPPDARDNWQLKAYAFSLMLQDPGLERVTVGLVVPAHDRVTYMEYSRKDLPALELEFIALEAKVHDPNKVPQPSADACKYCAAKVECPALRAIVLRTASLPVPTELDSSRMLAPTDLTKAMVLAGILEDWVARVKAHCLKLALEDGIETPGFALMSRAGRKTITEPVRVTELLKQDDGTQVISAEDVLNASSVSMTKLTEVVSAKGDMTKKAARAFVETKLEPILVESDRVMWLQKEKGKTYEEIIREQLPA